MIAWEKVAEEYNLTPQEFENEILAVAACVGAMSIDRAENSSALKFTCSDDVGGIELMIMRVDGAAECKPKQ